MDIVLGERHSVCLPEEAEEVALGKRGNALAAVNKGVKLLAVIDAKGSKETDI